MSEFRPLREQEDEPLPESPLLNLQLDRDFDASRFYEMREAIVSYLSTDADLLSCVGCPIPKSLIGDIKLSLAEMLANAQRPEAGRHATGIYVWAKEHQVGIGVGDDSDTIAGEDERPQTAMLAPDLGTVALDAYDADFSLEGLQISGQGGNLLLALASHISYSRVPEGEAAHVEEPRTHKIVRADFDVPFSSVQDQAA